MRARTVLPALLVCAAAAAGLWLALRAGRERPAERAAETSRGEEDGEPAAPALAAAARAGPAGRSPAGGAANAGTCEIHGLVRRGTAGEAVEVVAFGVPADEGPFVPVERLLGSLVAPDAKPAATARSGADGVFVVRGLAPGTYSVFVTAADGATARALARLRFPGERDDVQCYLRDATVRLRGRAVDRVGKPWRGLVGLGPLDDDVQVVLDQSTVARTAEDGTFELGAPEAGTRALLAVDASGVVAARLVSVPDDDVELRVEPGFFHRPGRVVARADERPVANARLETVDDETAVVVARASSDEDGRFVLFVPPGLTVRATAPGFAAATERVWYEIDVGAGLRRFANRLFGGTKEEPEEIVLKMSPGGTVAGRVRAADGTPVPGVTVVSTPRETRGGWSPRDAVGAATALSGADGSYEIVDAAAGVAFLSAAGNGWVTGSGEDVRVTVAAGTRVVVDLTVLRLGSLSGRVVDEDGRPVPGATVTWRASGGESFRERRPSEERTDADGRFSTGAVEPDVAYVVSAWGPEDPAVRGEAAVVARPGADTAIEITLRRARRLEVLVTASEDGRPLEGVAVFVQPAAEGWTSSQTTGADGRATFDALAPGAREVSARGKGRLTARVALPPPPAGTLSLPLARGETVRGRVLLPDGQPARGASVWSSGAEHSSGMTDEHGRFVLEGVGAGVALVQASLERLRATGRASGGAEVEIRLREPEPERRVGVRVIRPDGREAADARVAVSTSGGSALYRLSSREPVPVPAGSVVVAHEGDLVGRVGPTVGTESELVIGLVTGLHVEGVVRDEDGRPVAATVGVGPVDEDAARLPLSARILRHEAGADGAFRLGPLPPGPVRLWAEGPPHTGIPPARTVDAGTAGLVVVLPRGRVVRGIVVGRDGAAVGAARVWLAPDAPGGTYWEPFLADAAGRFRIERAPATPFAVRVGRADAGVAELAGSETVVPAGVTEVTLPLPPTGAIVVRVAGLGDGERPAAYLSRQDDDQEGAARNVPPAGDLYRFEDVPEGRYTFWLGPLPRRRYALVRDLRPGGREQRVELAAGGSATGRLGGFDPGQQAWARIWGPEVFAWTAVDADGRFAFDGLPPGEWTVHAHQYDLGLTTEGSGRVATGGEVEIELRPAR